MLHTKKQQAQRKANKSSSLLKTVNCFHCICEMKRDRFTASLILEQAFAVSCLEYDLINVDGYTRISLVWYLNRLSSDQIVPNLQAKLIFSFYCQLSSKAWSYCNDYQMNCNSNQNLINLN